MIDVKDITNFTVGLQTGMLPITQRKKIQTLIITLYYKHLVVSSVFLFFLSNKASKIRD